LLAEKLPWFTIVVVTSAVAVLAEEETGALDWLPGLTFSSQVANALIVSVLYLWKFAWPAGLMFFYPHPGNDVSWLAASAAAAFLAVITALFIWQVKRRPYLLVGWLWYLGTLVPVSGLVQVGGHRMADRYTDLPLIGISVAIAWSLAEISRKFSESSSTIAVSCVAVLLLLAGISHQQSAVWRSSVSLYEHALAVDSDNWVALSNYGLLLDDMKQHQLAMPIHERAVRANPDNPSAGNNLANAYLREERIDEAITCLTKILARKPDYYLAQSSLGAALTKKGRFEEAERHFRESLRLAPDVPLMHRNYGAFLAKQGRVDEAVEQFRESKRLDPANSDDDFNIALVLLSNQRYAEAIEAFSALIQQHPKAADALQGRARALAATGRLAESLEDYRRVLEINPRTRAAMVGASWILATAPEAENRNGELARQLAERACAETFYQGVDALDALAAANAELGNFERAAELADKALVRAKQSSNPKLAAPIEARLMLYREKKPYREPASTKAS
jgi:tetratricopeptide (TPR) repeat protein